MNQTLADIRAATVSLLALALIVYGCSFYQSVLRLHDLNLSGMWAMIPFASIVLAGCLPEVWALSVIAWLLNIAYFVALAPFLGSEDYNIYGEAPPAHTRSDYVPDSTTFESMRDGSILGGEQILEQGAAYAPDSAAFGPMRDGSTLGNGQIPRQSAVDGEASEEVYNRSFSMRTTPREYAKRVENSTARLFIDRYVQGRIGQFSYIIKLLTVWLAFICFVLLAKAIVGYEGPVPAPLKILILCVGFVLYIYSFCLNVMRLHDLNFSGIWAFIGVVAIVLTSFLGSLSSMVSNSAPLNLFAIFVNLMILAFLSALASMEEENNYGLAPAASGLSPDLETAQTRKKAILVPSILASVTLILIIINIVIR